MQVDELELAQALTSSSMKWLHLKRMNSFEVLVEHLISVQWKQDAETVSMQCI